VEGGKGGDGCVSFRREKFVPKGGPDGGDGGHGGSVILRTDPGVNTLYDLRHRKRFKAARGVHGKGKKMTGRNGADVILPVPVGTMVWEKESGVFLGDLTGREDTLIAARGGRGGRGNSHFATPTRQAPDFAEDGRDGESRLLRLELKLLADVGLVGFPNSGKSTLLSRISAARPKIANYPFTTLVPNLGIASAGEGKNFTVADIPGLIEGAHMGRGLGDRFLRHIERTRVLVFLIEATDADPESTYRILMDELGKFDRALPEKPRITVFSKSDLLSDEEQKQLPPTIGGLDVLAISSVTGTNVQKLLGLAAEKLTGAGHG
jgi:GTP-binding protein